MTRVTNLTSKDTIKSLISCTSYGDWFLLYFLASNIDDLHFRKFAIQLCNDGAHDKVVIDEENQSNPDTSTKSSFSDYSRDQKPKQEMYPTLDAVDRKGSKSEQVPKKDQFGESDA